MKTRILFAIVLFAQMPLLAQFPLFDQTAGKTTNALVAMDFIYYSPSYDCRIADDFDVPNGETWQIDSIELHGMYSSVTGTTDAAGMNVTIYQNNNGAIGTSIFSQVITTDLDLNDDGIITAYFATPITVPAGSYWLAASAYKDPLFDGKYWYWYGNTTNYGDTAMWENPGGLWGLGTNWMQITNANLNLNPKRPAVTFAIYGCAGTTKPNVYLNLNDTTFCAGSPVQLTAMSDSAGVSYVWNTGDTTATINALDSGIYTVTAYYPGSGCGSVIQAHINALPSPKSNVTNTTICAGGSITFSGDCPTCTYLWNDGSTANNRVVKQAGFVSVTITNPTTGCESVSSGTVSVYPWEPIEFVPGNPAIGCTGQLLIVTTGEAYKKYKWAGPGVAGASTTKEVIMTSGGEHYVTVTDDNNCAHVDTFQVIFQPTPTPTLVVDHTSEWITRLSTAQKYTAYKWSTGSTGPFTLAHSSGEYAVTVTDSVGCKGSVKNFIIAIPAGVTELAASGIEIYPNPANDAITVTCTQGNIIATLHDLAGRSVRQENLMQGNNTIRVADLPRGVYVLSLTGTNNAPIGQAKVVLMEE